MKKALAILAVLLFAATYLKAQQTDLYTVGYKDNSSTTRKALLYKNNEVLYSIAVSQKKITPYKVACDTKGNVYWLVVYSEGTSTKQTEIWKDDEVYLSTEGMSGYRITDLFWPPYGQAPTSPLIGCSAMAYTTASSIKPPSTRAPTSLIAAAL